MEDTLRGRNSHGNKKDLICLNPCFNGRYSQRRICSCMVDQRIGLNPCFNGRYSQSAHELISVTQ